MEGDGLAFRGRPVTASDLSEGLGGTTRRSIYWKMG